MKDLIHYFELAAKATACQHEVKFAREKLGLSQSDFSALLSVCLRQVGKWENGTAGCSGIYAVFINHINGNVNPHCADRSDSEQLRDELRLLETKYLGPFGPAVRMVTPGSDEWIQDHARMKIIRILLGITPGQLSLDKAKAQENMPENVWFKYVARALREKIEVPLETRSDFSRAWVNQGKTAKEKNKRKQLLLLFGYSGTYTDACKTFGKLFVDKAAKENPIIEETIRQGEKRHGKNV